MSQHDLIIDNADGATFRADLNAALAAMGSTQKGPTAPPAPVAGMLWVDDNTPSTTVWTLNQYDGTDWVSIGTLDTTNNKFLPTGVAPVPTASAGLGNFTLFGPGSGAVAVLPAGGTWAYFAFRTFDSSGSLDGNNAAGVSAGGTTIGGGLAGRSWIGFAWRIA